MTNSNAYIDMRRNYVEGSLSVALRPLKDFDSIKYAWSIKSGEEFIKISDIIGNVIYLDVTGLSAAEILKQVSKCVLMGDANTDEIIPETEVVEIDKKREIAHLFKQ